MKSNAKIISQIGLGILVVSLFVGCKPLFDLFRKKAEKEVVEVEKEVKEELDTSPVLLTIDGKTAITETKFKKHLNQMLQMNPYFRGAGIDSLPVQLQRKFFDELIKQEVILAWAYKNDMDEDSQFLKSLGEMIKLVKRSLLVQGFEKKIFDGIVIPVKERKDYFNKNKEKFVKDPGGVQVSGIKFDIEEKADDFYQKVRGKSAADFAKLAKKENEKNFKDFGRVGDGEVPKTGFMMQKTPASIKRKVTSIKRFPNIDKVKAGKDFWVAHFSNKKDKVYLTFEEIDAQQIEPMLKHNKFRDELNKHVDKVKSEFTLDINEDRFKQAAPPQLPAGGRTKAENGRANAISRRMARAERQHSAKAAA